MDICALELPKIKFSYVIAIFLKDVRVSGLRPRPILSIKQFNFKNPERKHLSSI